MGRCTNSGTEIQAKGLGHSHRVQHIGLCLPKSITAAGQLGREGSNGA